MSIEWNAEVREAYDSMMNDLALLDGFAVARPEMRGLAANVRSSFYQFDAAASEQVAGMNTVGRVV